MLTILYLLLIVISLLLIKQFVFNMKSENFYFHNLDTQDGQHDSSTPTYLEHRHDTSSASVFDSIDGNEDGNDNNDQTESVPSVSVTSQSISDTSQSDDSSEDPVGTTESIAPSEPIITNSSNRDLSPEEYWRMLVDSLREARERESNSTEPILTAQTDDNCCGLTIYNDDLQNINKCITQHISSENNDISGRIYLAEWKPTDSQSCRNPPHILAKTTNCAGNSSVISRYFPHIDTLRRIIDDSQSEGCPYRASMNFIDETENQIAQSITDEDSQNNRLTDLQQLSIFMANRRCGDRNLIGTELESNVLGSPYSVSIRQCSEEDPQ